MKPQPSRKSLFKKLKSLKKEYPYLEEPYSQVTQQKVQDLSSAFERFFKGDPSSPQYKKKYYDKSGFRDPQGYIIKENGEVASLSQTPSGFELNFKTLRVKLPAIGSMRFLPNQEFVGTAKSITVKNDGKYWKIIVLAEYEDEKTPDLTYAEIKNAIGVDLGLPLRLIPTIKRTISSLLKRLKSLKMRFKYLSAA